MMKFSEMNDLINELSDEPFKYGKCDCFIFTAKLVKAWHGKDYLPLHLKAYKNKKTAEEYMAKFNGIESLATGTLGYPVRAADLWDGDVALAHFNGIGDALGFVFNGRAYFKGPKKVMQMPVKKCLRGWRIR